MKPGGRLPLPMTLHMEASSSPKETLNYPERESRRYRGRDGGGGLCHEPRAQGNFVVWG